MSNKCKECPLFKFTGRVCFVALSSLSNFIDNFERYKEVTYNQVKFNCKEDWGDGITQEEHLPSVILVAKKILDDIKGIWENEYYKCKKPLEEKCDIKNTYKDPFEKDAPKKIYKIL